VVVELDDHNDSDVINAGLAAGSRLPVARFGPTQTQSQKTTDDLRLTFHARRNRRDGSGFLPDTSCLRSDPVFVGGLVGPGSGGELPDNETTRAVLVADPPWRVPSRPGALVMGITTAGITPPRMLAPVCVAARSQHALSID